MKVFHLSKNFSRKQFDLWMKYHPEYKIVEESETTVVVELK